MKNKSPYHLTIIWVIIGLFCIGLGLNGYYRYSEARFWSFMTHNSLYIRDIVFGLLAIGIGMKLLPQHQDENDVLDAEEDLALSKTIKWVCAYPIWIIGFIISATIIQSIQYTPMDFDFIFTIDYLFLFLAHYTILELTDKESITKKEVLQFMKGNAMFLLVGMVVLVGLIFSGSELLPYELFSGIRK